MQHHNVNLLQLNEWGLVWMQPCQAAILTPGHQNRTPELTAWARQLCQGTKQTSPEFGIARVTYVRVSHILAVRGV